MEITEYHCQMTGLPVTKFSRSNIVSYNLSFGIMSFKSISFCCNCWDAFIENPSLFSSAADTRRALLAALSKRIFVPDSEQLIHWNRDCVSLAERNIFIPDILLRVNAPSTSKARRDRLLVEKYNEQKIQFEGATLYVDTEVDNEAWSNFYLNYKEYTAAIHDLGRKGYITAISTKGIRDRVFSFRFTQDGIDYVESIIEVGPLSKNAFVAMSFDPIMDSVKAAIIRAITATGHTPIIVSDLNNPSDKTIPDRIFSELRQAKFCIADFTQHRAGVYFEAGFALGLGRPVIYTCQKTEFENAHFDIRQLQHIIYETPAELEVLLTDKINAWII